MVDRDAPNPAASSAARPGSRMLRRRLTTDQRAAFSSPVARNESCWRIALRRHGPLGDWRDVGVEPTQHVGIRRSGAASECRAGRAPARAHEGGTFGERPTGVCRRPSESRRAGAHSQHTRRPSRTPWFTESPPTASGGRRRSDKRRDFGEPADPGVVCLASEGPCPDADHKEASLHYLTSS